MLMYFLSFVVTFVTVFLKGFQHKNVIGGHLKMIALTSYAMAFFDVIAVSVIVKQGMSVAWSAGTGAALGMLVSVLLHDKIFGKKENDS
jgi:hypothetical protein